MVDSRHRLSRHELRVEQRDCLASSTLSEEKVVKGGRAEETREEKWVGERLRRLRRNKTIRGIFMSPRMSMGHSCSGMDDSRVSSSCTKSPSCPGGR